MHERQADMKASRMVAVSCLLLLAVSLGNAAVCSTRPTLKLYSGYRSKGQGHLSGAVKELQALLDVSADGYFGPGTATAVRSYQKRNGLTADGIVGRNTWKSLCGASAASSSGSSTASSSDCDVNNPHAASKTYNAGGWTPRMVFVIDAVNNCFPGKFKISYQARKGSDCPGSNPSDHCFGNAIDPFPGTYEVAATGQDKIDGDELAAWCVTNAAELKIKYVIWYKRIWSTSKPYWRDYTTYGSNPGVTKGHYDHVHISVL